MTEGEPYITDGTTDSVFVRAIDDKSDSKTGTIDCFAGEHLVWNLSAVSEDPPVSIPDYNVGVFARTTIPPPHDVGVAAILAPADTVDSGTSLSPQVRVKNYGSEAATFPVFFRIGAYADSQNVANLAAGDSALVSLPPWTALERGAHLTRCSTALSDDDHHSNDTLNGSVVVRVRDVACVQILEPLDTIDFGTAVMPRAVVKNAGTITETFETRFAIGAEYADTISRTLAAGGSQTINSAGWLAFTLGTLPTVCATMLATDMNPANDTTSDSIVVVGHVGVAEQPRLPHVLSLEWPAPDPMRGRATVRFSIPHRAQTSLSICSAIGAPVRVLSCPRSFAPGTYSVTWDGRDEQGRRVGKGIYFWRLVSDYATLTRKAIKID
jgi:hypothetical protein